MPECMDLDHGGHDISRNQRVTHPCCCLYHAIAYVTHGEDTRFATCFKDPVAHFGDQWFEMERAGVAHAPRAVDQHLWLGEIFFSPVHAQSKGVSLMVVCPEFLTTKLPLRAGHAPSPPAQLYAVSFCLPCILPP